MDFCILGLLLMKAQSSYELNQAFAQSLSLFYSSSLGSIQIALKKLLALGYVELQSEESGGRRKKIWQATAAGEVWFRSAMHSPLNPARLEESALARLHFLGLVDDPAERCRVLELIVATVERALAGLEDMAGQYQNLEHPAPWNTWLRYQLATLDYGLASHRQGLAWFRTLLESERRSR